MSEVLLVALGAGGGAALRFLAARAFDDAFPWGTLLVNLIGSLVLGALVGLGLSDSLLMLLGVGLAGGLTTYSAFAVQTQVLAVRRKPMAAAYVVSTVVACFASCALGYAIGRTLS